MLLFFQSLMSAQYFQKTAFEEYIVFMVLELKLRSYVKYECIKCMLLESYGYVDCGREDPDTV